MARLSAARSQPRTAPEPPAAAGPRARAAARPVPEGPRARPFLKWAGGKGQLLEQIRPLLPETRGRYFEPFAGGAAMFFSLGPRDAFLADVNAELVDCYRAVKSAVDAVIEALGSYEYGADHYYKARGVDPATLPLAQRAARTIYLNRTGYNGLYRVNRAGRFNVPMGRYTNPMLCDPPNLHACSAALARTRLEVADFEDVATQARRGDFVYFDPPYVPVSETSAFTSYAAGGFGPDQQQRLATLFARLARRGVRVMLSNSDTPVVRELYCGFRIHRVLASRHINSRGTRRGKVGEVVVTSYR